MVVINNVQAYRKEMKLTQEQLAQRVGVTRKTIVSLEKGNYVPSLLLALQLADVFKIDINHLFYLSRNQ